jgi:tRNA nucleotidyltransferase (CCA-adding enzyme)
VKDNQYGVLTIEYNDFKMEIATYRGESAYKEHRYPIDVKFVDTLEEDLQRRDFIINTLCINQDGEYVDKLGALDDINKKIIKTVKDPYISLKEDSLRILRAIRFSAVLNFKIDVELEKSIIKNKQYLTNIPKYFIKREANKILNTKIGEELLKKYDLLNFVNDMIKR